MNSKYVNSSIQDIYAAHPEIEKDVLHLKEWLAKQAHLPPVSDLQLVTFLKCSNQRLEAAKSCIDSYFTVKTGSPEFFSNRDPRRADLQQVATVGQIAPLTTHSPEGYHYVFARLITPDVSRFEVNTFFTLAFMIIDTLLKNNVMAPGIVVIFDMTHLTMSHLLKVNITSLKKLLMYVQFAMPVKLLALHVIHVTPTINSIMAFLKPFLSKEILALLHFHAGDEGMAEFHQSVPKKCMPKDYGGDDDTVHNIFEKYRESLLDNREWLLADGERCKVDETKRVGKILHGDDLFGQQGSFKKLSID